MLFHGATLLLNSLKLAALWRAVIADEALVASGGGGEHVKDFDAIGRAIVPGIALYIVATAIGVVAPRVGVWGYLVIALMLLVRVRQRTEPVDSE